MQVDLTAIRAEYARVGLDERDVDPSPFAQLDKWLNEAVAAGDPRPIPMTLATATPEGEPSARVMMLSGLDDKGLLFFSSYQSPKGSVMAANPRACASFFWGLLERQARVTGTVARITREESVACFAARPRDAQLGAWATHQSSVVAGRAEVEARLEQVRARFREADIPCPPEWGGYRLAPDMVELWQGRPNRLHDRLRYSRTGDATWRIDRLSP